MTDFDRYICGGYRLVKRVPRGDGLTDLLPDNIITLSNCFAETAPDDWALDGYNYDDEERAAEALKFGIPAAAVPELVTLMSRESGALHSNAFPTLSVAREFYRSCGKGADVALVGIGLHPTLI